MAELGRRPLWAWARAARDRDRWRALTRLPRVAGPIPRVLAGYLLRRGGEPAPVRVRTPSGKTSVQLRHPHDYATLVEVLAEEVYPVGPEDRIVVDIGANVGVFSVYALTRHGDVRVHAFEPVPENLSRLRANLAPFGERATVNDIAAAREDGEVSFGVEATGRYGGIGVATAEAITVTARAIADILAEIIAAEGRIDVLKLDVEGLERELLEAVPAAIAERIGRVALEWPHADIDTAQPWADLGFAVRGGPKTWVLERSV